MKTLLPRFFAAWLLILLSGCAPTPNPGTQSQATDAKATVRVDAADATTQSGQTLTVPIRAENMTDLTAAEFHLSFDPQMLEVTAINPGTFLQADFVAQNNFDNNAGTIDYAIAQINKAPAQGSGVVFEIVFRAKSPGSSPVQFRATSAAPAGVLLANAEAKAIDVSLINGAITIK